MRGFRRIVLAPQGDRRLVELHQAIERCTSRGDHRPAQLGAEQPGRLVRSQPQLRLQLQGGDAVGVGGHQVRRPEPDGERQLRAVHHRAGGHRGLPGAGGALPGERLGRELPALRVPARRAAEPVRPAQLCKIRGTRRLVRKATLKLDERARKVGHGRGPPMTMFVICSTPSDRRRHHISCRRSHREQTSSAIVTMQCLMAVHPCLATYVLCIALPLYIDEEGPSGSSRRSCCFVLLGRRTGGAIIIENHYNLDALFDGRMFSLWHARSSADQSATSANASSRARRSDPLSVGARELDCFTRSRGFAE